MQKCAKYAVLIFNCNIMVKVFWVKFNLICWDLQKLFIFFTDCIYAIGMKE